MYRATTRCDVPLFRSWVNEPSAKHLSRWMGLYSLWPVPLELHTRHCRGPSSALPVCGASQQHTVYRQLVIGISVATFLGRRYTDDQRLVSGLGIVCDRLELRVF